MLRIFCGTTRFNETTLFFFSRLLNHILIWFVCSATFPRPRHSQYLKDGIDKDGFIIVGILRQRYLEQRTSGAPTPMPSAIFLLTRSIGKNFAATDDRDVVYSLKGILRDLDEINVDYNRSAVDLFEDVATKFIQESSSLDILAQASSQHRDSAQENLSDGGKRHRVGTHRKGWPSWVPNFAAASNAPSLDSFDASAGMSVVWSKGDSIHKLQIYGVPIGKIQTKWQRDRVGFNRPTAEQAC